MQWGREPVCYDIVDVDLCRSPSAIFVAHKLLIRLLSLEDLGKLLTDFQLKVRCKDLDLLELIIFFFDAAEFKPAEDRHI